jgi:small subunit ribosomal protein S1
VEGPIGAAPRRSLGELQVGQELEGTVTKVELFGAFVNIGAERDGLVHISNLRKERVNRVEDVVTAGQAVQVWVSKVDPASGRVELTMVRPVLLKWPDIKPGMRSEGTVVKVERFGAFVDIGAERPGLVHVSEMSNEYVANPAQIAKEGDKVTVTVLEVDRAKRQIRLTMKQVPEAVEAEPEEAPEAIPSAMEIALRRAMAGSESAEPADATPAAEKPPAVKRKPTRRVQEDILARTLQQRIK